MNVFSDKLNVGKIMKDHWATFGDVEGNGKFYDWFSFYLLPLMGTIFYSIMLFLHKRIDIPADGWCSVITVTSILIPLMLAMIASLVGIIKKDNERFYRLVKELISNSSYGILVAVFLLGVALVAIVIGEGRAYWLSSLFVFLTSHLLLTLLMIVKRFYTVALRCRN